MYDEATPGGTTGAPTAPASGGSPDPTMGQKVTAKTVLDPNQDQKHVMGQLLHQMKQLVNDQEKSGKTDKDIELEATRMMESMLAGQLGMERRMVFPSWYDRDVTDLAGRSLSELHQMPGITNPRIREWQHECDKAYLLDAIYGNPNRKTFRKYLDDGGMKSLDSWKRVSGLTADLQQSLTRAATSPWNITTATEGKEFIPTMLSANWLDYYRLKLSVASLFNEVVMESPVFQIPVITTRPRAKRRTEASAKPSSIYAAITLAQPATALRTLTAYGFYTAPMVTSQASQAAIVNIMNLLREQAGMSMRDCLEDGLLNGDTAGTHQDADVTAADDIRTMWLGLRAYCLDIDAAGGSGSTAVSAVDSVTAFRAARAKLGKYGVNPSETAYIVSPKSFLNLVKDSNVATWDKFGPQATILNGQLGAIEGTPVIVSEFQRHDIDNEGKYVDGADDVSTSILVNHTQAFWGVYGSLTVETFHDPINKVDTIIIDQERAWGTQEDAGAATSWIHMNRALT